MCPTDYYYYCLCCGNCTAASSVLPAKSPQPQSSKSQHGRGWRPVVMPQERCWGQRLAHPCRFEALQTFLAFVVSCSHYYTLWYHNTTTRAMLPCLQHSSAQQKYHSTRTSTVFRIAPHNLQQSKHNTANSFHGPQLFDNNPKHNHRQSALVRSSTQLLLNNNQN